MITRKDSYLSKWYTVLIALYPFLAIYEILIPKVSFADFILAIILFLNTVIFFSDLHAFGKDLTFKKYFYKTIPVILFFVVYICIVSLFQMICNTKISGLSTIRFLGFCYALLTCSHLFDFKFAIKVLRISSIIISIYVLMQFVYFNLTKDTLTWRIKFLKVIDTNFIDIESSPYFEQWYRPTGVFYEPTHFSQFVMTYIPYSLFVLKGKKRWIEIAIISLAILCSGSSAGLLLLLFAFLLYFIGMFIDKKTRKKSIILFIAFVIVFFWLMQIPYFAKIIERMQNENGSFVGPAVQYRFKYVYTLFDNSRNIFEKLFGTGRGSELHYFTSIFYLINAHGFIGLFIFMLALGFLFTELKSTYQRNFILILILLALGSEILFNFGFLVYFSFFLFYEQDTETIKSNKFYLTDNFSNYYLEIVNQ